MFKIYCALFIITLNMFNCVTAHGYNLSDTALIEKIKLTPKEAFRYIQAQVIKQEVSSERKAELRVLLSEVAYFIDQPEHIVKYAEQAIASGRLNQQWHTRGLISLARGYYQKKEYQQFYTAANTAVLNADNYSFPMLKVAALAERAFANVLLGNKVKAKTDLTLVAKYLRLLPDVFEKAIVLERFSAGNIQFKNLKTALKFQNQAIDIYQKNQGSHFLSAAFYNLARIYSAQKSWQQANDYMMKSYRWALNDKNKLNQAFALSRIAEYQMELGHKERAEQHLKEAVAAADESASERVVIHARTKMAHFICQKISKISECQALLNETIAFANAYKMFVDVKVLTRMLADNYAIQGDFEKAYSTLKDTL